MWVKIPSTIRSRNKLPRTEATLEAGKTRPCSTMGDADLHMVRNVAAMMDSGKLRYGMLQLESRIRTNPVARAWGD